MSTIDSRIVTMKFDNKQFERAASVTMSTLGKLKNALDLGATNKALGGLGKGFNLGGMGAQVDGVSAKFLALSTVAVTALVRISNAAFTAGKNFAKQFSGIEGMRAGFEEYETNLNSIQTILANTDGENLKTVNAALDQLNKYSDQTIYNFSEMARNIGTFTAAGVGLDQSVQSIKGIANLAALSGSSSQQASAAMYQLSQAIAAGRVSLMDWNSVVNAGMGGKVFQEALINTAVAMGKIDKTAVKISKETGRMTINGKAFRESISGGDSWLSSDILTSTLAQFSGDLTDAQLKAQGFTKAQIRDIRSMAKEAQDAATKVKTFSQLIGTIKESIGSGWAQTWRLVFGDFKEARQLWTGVNDVIGEFISTSADARNKVLKDWKALGGRQELIEGIGNVFKALFAILKPIRDAFRDVFPPSTGKQLYEMTVAFRKFTEGLIVSDETAQNIRDTFRGVFSVLKIGATIFGAIIKYVAEFFGIIVSGGGGSALLAIAGAIGRVVAAIQEWLFEGDKLNKFFDSITAARNAVLEPLVGTISSIIKALVALASGDISGFFENLDAAGGKFLDLIQKIAERIGDVGAAIGGFLGGIGRGGFEVAVGIFERIGNAIDSLKSSLGFGSVSIDAGPLDKAASSMERLSWIGELARFVWDSLVGTIKNVQAVAGPVFENIGKLVGLLGDKFVTFAEGMNLTDAVAVANTGAFLLLYKAFRDVLKVFKEGLEGFSQIGGSISGTFDQLTNNLKTMQTEVRAKAIRSIAISIGILALSLIGLSLVPMDKLKNGLIALGSLFAMLGTFLGVLSIDKLGIAGTGIIQAGSAMVLMAGAIGLLTLALKGLEDVGWETIAGKFPAMMASLVTSMLLLGNVRGPALIGAKAIFVIAPAMIMLAGAMKVLEVVDWSAIAKMGVALLALAVPLGALGYVGPAVLAGAAAIFVVAPALVVLASALALLQVVKWESLGKLAATLGVMALGVTAMIGALPGAVALGVVAVSLMALIPPLAILSTMSFGTIIGAFAKLGAGLLVLSLIAGPLSPLLIILATAVGVLGVGMLAAGAGMLLFATGLSLVSAVGAVAFGVLMSGITSFLAILPQWVLQFSQTLIAIATVIKEAGPQLVEALTVVLIAMINSVIKITPKLGRLLTVLIKTGLRVIRKTIPDWVKTGVAVIMAFLNGIEKNIGKITDKAVNIIIKFSKALSRNSPKLFKAAKNMMIDMGKKMFGEIGGIADDLYQKCKEIGKDIVAGIIKGLGNIAKSVGGALKKGLGGAVSGAKKLLGIGGPSRVFCEMGKALPQGMADGIDSEADKTSIAMDRMATKALGAFQSRMATISELVDMSMDMNPTIAPVLDLSGVKTEAKALNDILSAQPVSTGLAADAQALATEYNRSRPTTPEEPVTKEVKMEFHQTNTSPKALSSIEIYRQTNNQLSLAKEALDIHGS